VSVSTVCEALWGNNGIGQAVRHGVELVLEGLLGALLVVLQECHQKRRAHACSASSSARSGYASALSELARRDRGGSTRMVRMTLGAAG